MAGRGEPPSDSDGNEAETTGDPECQVDELHVQISDLRRLPYEGAAHVPWRQQRVQLPRPVVDVALAVTLVALLLVATPIGSGLVAFAARRENTETVTTPDRGRRHGADHAAVRS